MGRRIREKRTRHKGWTTIDWTHPDGVDPALDEIKSRSPARPRAPRSVTNIKEVKRGYGIRVRSRVKGDVAAMRRKKGNRDGVRNG